MRKKPDRQPCQRLNDLRSSGPLTENMNRKHTTSRRGLRWRAVVARGTLAFCAAGHARAEVESELDAIVVSAMRGVREAGDVSSAVSVFDPRDWEKRGLLQLRDALNESPGVIATSTGGQTGALGSVFIRGTNTAYSQLVVDGMRLSDSTTQLGSMLAASRVFDLGRVEILRGAQGAMYGGESIGGVLWMETARGAGEARGTWFAEAGSFDSFNTALRYEGEHRGLSYFLSAGYEETANDGPMQDFHQGSAAMRFEQRINDSWQAGITYRGVDAFYQARGQSEDSLEASLVTVYLNGQVHRDWKTTLHAGFHQEMYDSESLYGFGTDLRAWSLSNDHEWRVSESLVLMGGVFAHRSDYENTYGTAAARDRYGVHIGLEWESVSDWKHHAALRWEDYDAYGDEMTWRVGTAYHHKATGTILRAGVGSSFKAPSYLDLFGSVYGAGNPDLKAESSLGWDIGIEQNIGEHHRVVVTVFHNAIEDRIDSFAVPMPVNLPGETHSQGVEVSLQGNLFDEVMRYRIAYTYLPRSMSGHPRHHAHAGLEYQATEKLLLGIGLHALSDHSWGGSDIDGYAVGRLHASYQLRETIRLHARWENFTNESYLLSDFYGDAVPAAGSAVFAGVTLEW
jgi:vitamin B12 transporter